MEASAARVLERLQMETLGVAALRGLSDAKVFGAYLDRCDTMFDFEWGGFGGVSKFPQVAFAPGAGGGVTLCDGVTCRPFP
jgi:hypothetical protein